VAHLRRERRITARGTEDVTAFRNIDAGPKIPRRRVKMKSLNSNETSVDYGGLWSGARVRGIAVAALAGVGVYLCYRLAQPCIPSLVWAGALAIVFHPLHRYIESKVKGPNKAAAISLLVIGLLVVVPATWFAQQAAEQAILIPQTIQKQIAAGKWHIASNEHPLLASLLALVEQHVKLPNNTAAGTTWFNTIFSRFIKESALAAIQVCLTLYFLFHFLRDRARVLKSIRSILPLATSETDTLFRRLDDTIHATLYGMVALSALQALLGGLMFSWFGVPSPWFWAFLAGVFAFVPVLDAIVLWLPAAVYLGLEGRWGEALGVAALGTLLVRGIENFLYPVLVNHRLRIPSVRIFVSLIGGLLLFGSCGIVLGPVILTATIALVEICANRMREPNGQSLGSVEAAAVATTADENSTPNVDVGFNVRDALPGVVVPNFTVTK
jgi:predicted PurR-regulated permease PerM